jgi:leader peptidase (prepilin peptidase) / N-methyltransferase
MNTGNLLIWSSSITGLLFVFALGAIVGSFINVVAYRVPAGLGLVLPPSACPKCETRLTWRENFPILGWLWLGGKCRFCRSTISPQYPLIELIVALLFASLYALWYMQPSVFSLMGLDGRAMRPEFTADGLMRTWPVFVAILFLIGALVSITLIDAKTFMIPLSIPLIASAVGIVAHTGNAIWIQATRGGLRAGETVWAIPTVSGGWLGAAIGAAGGLVIANVLLRLQILPVSFADYADWEKSHQSTLAAAGSTDHKAPAASGPPLRVVLLRTLYLTGPAIALMLVGFTLALPIGKPIQGMVAGAAGGLLVGLFLRRLVPDSGTSDADPVWVQYPHARREMVKELLFLLPTIGLAVVGFWLARNGGPLAEWFESPPLWLRALGGSVMGYLAGGGLIWGTRILASFVFGKEAMGLGDVHLMAAVGAVLGWVNPILAFFTAPFFGLAWAAASVLFKRFLPRIGSALPYGPHLAAGALVALYFKPLYDALLSLIGGGVVHLP